MIPVLLVAGCLGAGKTTLLNHLLRARHGRRVGVVVNDFGSIGVDAMTVAAQVDAMVALGNGCLCCAVDTAALDALLARLARPVHRLDAVVVEASGLAEPRELVRQLLSTTASGVVYGGLVLVVDGTAPTGPAGTADQDDRLIRDLAVADLVVVSKADLLERPARQRLHDRLAASGRPVLLAEHGAVDPDLLFEVRPAPVRRRGGRPVAEQLSLTDLLTELDRPDPVHRHTGWTSVAVSSADPLCPAAFLDLVAARPPGLFRAKGFVTFTGAAPAEPNRRFAVHVVGDHLRFGPPPRAAADGPTELVLLGAGMDAVAVRAAVDSCRRPAGAAPSPAARSALGRVRRLAGVG